MKKNRMKKSIKAVIRILPSLVAGMIFGIIVGAAMGAIIERYFADSSPVMALVLFLVFFILSYILQMIIHEGGHLVFGLLSGYSFVSFRIFNVIFIKENSKLIRKKFNIVGTGGQCLMMPPEPVDGRYPYVLYNLGGSLMNFIACGICLVPILLFPSSPILVLALSSCILIGLFTGLMNIIPLKISGIANDGHNAMSLGKNDAARRAFWLSLHTNALTSDGVRYKDMPAEWFSLPEETNFSDPIIASSAILRFNYMLDRHEFERAKAFGEDILKSSGKMLELHQNELRCELLFIEIIGECRQEEIDRLYTKQLKKYIAATSSYVSRQRLLYAYEKLVTLDVEEAENVLARFEKVSVSFPNKGEIEGEREMISIIDDRASALLNKQ